MIGNISGTFKLSDASSSSCHSSLDNDGEPEIILVDGGGTVRVYSVDGVELWVTHYSADVRGGPPTLADFDGDGFPEIGVAFSSAYRVLDGDGTTLWSQDTDDYSSGVTGSAVFDFEGDGAAEVVYADEHVLYIYDGATGTIELAFEDHASGTLIEYPVIVDIDGDDSAEIILPSNNMWWSGNTGITVIGDEDNSWAPARRIWNQHAYHITNIDDDGTIPERPDPNWEGLNSFRAANSETYQGLERPDLQPGPPEECLEECALDRVVLYIPIENTGLVDIPNVEVSLYTVHGADPHDLYEQMTLPVAQQGQARWIGPITLDSEAFGAEGVLIRVDDDGTGTSLYDECDEENNEYRIPVNPCLDAE